MLEELLALGDRVVARANPGEQIEAIVVNETDTEVRVFEGDIESFTSATSQGIGIRVINDMRQGFAWAGSLDQDVIDSALSEARDNATFGSIDFGNVLRDDDYSSANVGLAYKPNRHSEWSFSYEYEDKDSNLPRFDFETNTVFLSYSVSL